MKTNDYDISEESQRELAPDVLKQSTQRELAAGMLKQAAHDLRRFNRATSRLGQELYLDAYRWLTADEFSWPFSFLNVCRALSLTPETVRDELISDLSLGTVRYWKRRGERAARRLRIRLAQLFVRELNNETGVGAGSRTVSVVAT